MPISRNPHLRMMDLIWAIWWWQSPLHLRELATAVIRAIDSALITLMLVGLWWRLMLVKPNRMI